MNKEGKQNAVEVAARDEVKWRVKARVKQRKKRAYTRREEQGETKGRKTRIESEREGKGRGRWSVIASLLCVRTALVRMNGGTDTERVAEGARDRARVGRYAPLWRRSRGPSSCSPRRVQHPFRPYILPLPLHHRPSSCCSCRRSPNTKLTPCAANVRADFPEQSHARRNLETRRTSKGDRHLFPRPLKRHAPLFRCGCFDRRNGSLPGVGWNCFFALNACCWPVGTGGSFVIGRTENSGWWFRTRLKRETCVARSHGGIACLNVYLFDWVSVICRVFGIIYSSYLKRHVLL